MKMLIVQYNKVNFRLNFYKLIIKMACTNSSILQLMLVVRVIVDLAEWFSHVYTSWVLSS